MLLAECQKCTSPNGLHLHHLTARQDGGGDEPDNLITLCEKCHREWHFCESINRLSFGAWMKCPPYTAMLAYFQNSEEARGETMTVAQMVRTLAP